MKTRNIRWIDAVVLVLVFIHCGAPHAHAVNQEEALYQEYAHLKQLKDTDPQAYQEAINLKKQNIQKQIQSISAAKPENYNAFLREQNEGKKRRLNYIKQQHPDEFRGWVDHKMQHLDQLKDKAPAKYQRLMERHPDLPTRAKQFTEQRQPSQQRFEKKRVENAALHRGAEGRSMRQRAVREASGDLSRNSDGLEKNKLLVKPHADGGAAEGTDQGAVQGPGPLRGKPFAERKRPIDQARSYQPMEKAKEPIRGEHRYPEARPGQGGQRQPSTNALGRGESQFEKGEFAAGRPQFREPARRPVPDGKHRSHLTEGRGTGGAQARKGPPSDHDAAESNFGRKRQGG